MHSQASELYFLETTAREIVTTNRNRFRYISTHAEDLAVPYNVKMLRTYHADVCNLLDISGKVDYLAKLIYAYTLGDRLKLPLPKNTKSKWYE